jgi:hypothetical protein
MGVWGRRLSRYRTGQAQMPRPPRLSRLTPLSSNLRAQAQRERRFAHTEAPYKGAADSLPKGMSIGAYAAITGERNPTSAVAPTSRVPKWCLRSRPLGQASRPPKRKPRSGGTPGFPKRTIRVWGDVCDRPVDGTVGHDREFRLHDRRRSPQIALRTARLPPPTRTRMPVKLLDQTSRSGGVSALLIPSWRVLDVMAGHRNNGSFSGLCLIRRVAGWGNAALDANVAPRNRIKRRKPRPRRSGFSSAPNLGGPGLLPGLATGDSF